MPLHCSQDNDPEIEQRCDQGPSNSGNRFANGLLKLHDQWRRVLKNGVRYNLKGVPDYIVNKDAAGADVIPRCMWGSARYKLSRCTL